MNATGIDRKCVARIDPTFKEQRRLRLPVIGNRITKILLYKLG